MNGLARAASIVSFVLAASAAHGKIVSVEPTGFVVEYRQDFAATPKSAYDTFVAIGGWWGSDHTYSGDAKNMSIEIKNGGCWCETLTGGGFVRHMEVKHAAPGQRLVMTGGLGPLLYMGVAGSMAVTFETKDQSTRVTLRYAVGGYDPKKFEETSNSIDQVLSEQFARYAKAITKP